MSSEPTAHAPGRGARASAPLESAPRAARAEGAHASQSAASHPAAELAIDVRNVSKSYRIYPRPFDRFRQALAWGRRQYYREFWALHEVSLTVRRGETVGIIGRNGSGKSTLLQIIAGTLAPTGGEVCVGGRVAALLELGSGFHAEATGRENVFMNGAILGLSQAQIAERYDDIVAFAEIGEFLEQPVKTYSSGMVVRLAFAVAAHVSADILIVDEALSVGDEGFQRKCFSWLERFRERGGTLLFVTHGAQTVVKLCDRALLLERGARLAIGDSKPVVDVYQKLLYGTHAQQEAVIAALRRVDGRAELLPHDERAAPDAEVHPEESERGAECPPEADPAAPVEASAARFDANLIRPPETTYGNGEAEILDPAMHDAHGRRANVLDCGQTCSWRYRVRFDRAAEAVNFGVLLKTTDGVEVAGTSSGHLGQRLARVESGQIVEVAFAFRLNLAPGTYFLNSGVSCIRDGQETYLHRRVDVAAIRVLAPDAREGCGLAFVDPRLALRVVGVQVEAHV